MKNLLIATNYIGFFHFLWDDIDIYNQLGYKIYALADNSKNEYNTIKILEEKGVAFFDARIDGKKPLSKKNFQYYMTVKKLQRRYKFEVVHCHTPIVGLIIRYAFRKYRKIGTKVIYTTHGLAYTHLSSKKEHLVFHSIESFASRFSDAIITINLEDYNNVLKLHCKNVYHINGVGVDIAKYKDIVIDKFEYRKKLGISDDKIMILSIGELSIRKNHIVIVDAISKLKNKDNYVFAICGRRMTGSGTGDLIQKMAEEKGVNVKFLGFRDDIPNIVHCADIGAIPSIREGLGLAGIEMLSAGIPLVGSDVQGIREYIINGKTGFLCNPYDAESFAEAIEKLSSDEFRKSLRENCLEVVKKFDKKISVSQREKIYREILS